MALTHIAFTGSRVALSLYALTLQVSPFVVGLLMSLLGVIPMLISVPAGRWTDRVGPVRPAIISIVSVLVGTLVPAVFQNISSLYVASVIVGGLSLAHLKANAAAVECAAD